MSPFADPAGDGLEDLVESFSFLPPPYLAIELRNEFLFIGLPLPLFPSIDLRAVSDAEDAAATLCTADIFALLCGRDKLRESNLFLLALSFSLVAAASYFSANFYLSIRNYSFFFSSSDLAPFDEREDAAADLGEGFTSFFFCIL